MVRRYFADFLPAALQVRPRSIQTGTLKEPVTTFDELTERLGYLPKGELRLIRDAYRFADQAHLGQRRASGEPYITHPLAVAGLVADLRLDAQAIMAALMHDAMEDCGVTKAELIQRFGAPTAELVDGLTKLEKVRFSTKEEGQAESFRKMLLAMSRDFRVILVKLADRLHNMRTLGAVRADKRARIARETLEIYVPIAHHLGLNQFYRELQELGFAALHPWRHAVLSRALVAARGMRRDIVGRVHKEVEEAFARAKMKVSITGREKSVYSIYRKMRQKHLSFAKVNDIFGLRVVVGSQGECYLALGVLHQLYKPLPGRFKDYIAIPKPNGYRSLHTTLVNAMGTPLEMQIRTEEMHAIAEHGVAAHWLYKIGEQGKGEALAADAMQRLGAYWLKSLMDIQQETHDSAEFLEHVKIDLVPDAVYVFTPGGKIVSLPRGATPVDFAYEIHTRVGDHCAGAIINGETAALHAQLHSGDVVEILTNPTAEPNPQWLNFVRTGRARSKVRHHLRTLAADDSVALGHKLLISAVRAEGLELPPYEAAHGAPPHPVWPALLKWSSSKTVEDLLLDIGLGRKMAPFIAKRVALMLVELGENRDPLALPYSSGSDDADAPTTQVGMQIDGSEGGSVIMATCCYPIPGDAIVAYFGRGEGLVVHTTDCRVGRRQAERSPERWMKVEWADEPVRAFEAAIQVLVTNVKGALAQVAQSVSSAEADITFIDMSQGTMSPAVEFQLRVAVRDRLHLAEVLRTVRRCPIVMKVARVRAEGPGKRAVAH